ncbi:MAG: DUF2283 domain-containing protein [Candidatus Bathyarchaeia archaeon]
MEKEGLKVWFDPEGDLLEVELSKPRKGFFKDLGDDVFLRVDEKGNVLGFVILNVTKRVKNAREVELPIKASFSKIKQTA